MIQGLPPALAFLLFAALTFIALRVVIDKLARMQRPVLAGPILAAFGALSGAYFFQMGLHRFFIWHLVLFALVILSWHAKSRVDDRKLMQMAGPSGSGESAPDQSRKELIQSYGMTRRLLSFGLVSYLAAFSAAYYYLFTR